MRNKTLGRLVVSLSLALVSAAAVRPVCANECGALESKAKSVCQEAERQLHALSKKWPDAAKPGQPCAPARVIDRLDRFVAGLKIGIDPTTLYLDETFAVHTIAVPDDGAEYERTVLFYDEPDEVELHAEAEFPSAQRPAGSCVATPDEAAVIKPAALAVEQAIAEYNKPALVTGAAQLRKLSDTWRWVITDGFGEFPWERALNTKLDRKPLSIYRLPKTEWVFLHPSVGVQFVGGSPLSDTRVKAALLIEPFGFVRYRFRLDEAERHYMGASLLMALGEDVDPGYGALVRYDAYSLGVVRHSQSSAPAGGADHTWGVTATIELLERLQTARTKWKSAADKAQSLAADAN